MDLVYLLYGVLLYKESLPFFFFILSYALTDILDRLAQRLLVQASKMAGVMVMVVS